MMWLGLIRALVGLATMIARHVERRGIAKDARAQAYLATLLEMERRTDAAMDARERAARDLDDNSDRLRDDDGFRRD